MNPIRRKILRNTLLEILGDAGGYSFREKPDLISHLNLMVTPMALESEMEEVLTQMASRNEIVRVRFDDEVKCKITDDGEIELAKLRKTQ